MIEKRPKESHLFISNTLITICRFIIYNILFVFLITACSKDKPDKIASFVDRSKMPKLHATEISTIISDSGVTRYRITAPSWDVYDKANQPYWEFTKGINFERFDLNLKVDANIHSKYAKFNENEQLWDLRGKVKMTNIQGELFETEQLFWNQRQERFYSDSLIKITQTSRIISGIGFESNQTMTNYTIKNPQGIFPINDNANTSAPPTSSPPTQTSTPKPKPIQTLPTFNAKPLVSGKQKVFGK
jgi:LPS export ABC transporter protein LptC